MSSEGCCSVAEPRAGASNANANPNLWKTAEPAPDPFAEASNEVRRKTASGSAKPGAVIDMNAEDDGGVDRVVTAPRRSLSGVMVIDTCELTNYSEENS